MASTTAQTGTITTQVPARLDRLPWSRFHWMVVIGLGTVWILDGLEVTIVGSIGARLTEAGSGLNLTAGQIGIAAGIYVAGACTGALFFGQLTDRLGRKKLFIATLAVYLAATVATAFSFAPWYFFLCRFVTGAGIGGEYAAINSAIDELIPARVRGRVDLIINGSYWLGAAAGSAVALIFLDLDIFPRDLGWRFAFGLGAVFGLVILVVRRHVPESPRWLFIHGRQEEAERLVDGIEEEIREETGEELAEPGKSLTIRQRRAIPFREIARVAFTLYPKRAVLGLSLFVGQAFLYNGITFNLGTLLGTFFAVASGTVPLFLVAYGLSNFLGPVTLGRLFDTVGRKPMIAGCYLGSAAIAVALAVLFVTEVIDSPWFFMAGVMLTFFFASAGASAAYLTVSEIFPMETRALAIAFFYAIGTAAGGIAGPLLFGQLVGTDERGPVAIAFVIGAVVMAIGGIVELLFGVKAEKATLEDIAAPLTVEEAKEGTTAAGESGDGAGPDARPARQEARRAREQAAQARAEAAEHRARVHELRAAGAEEGVEGEEGLAELCELRARALDERAAAQDRRAEGEADAHGNERTAVEERARAAEERARGFEERAAAVAAEDATEAERHLALAAAADERSRSREHRAGAAGADGEAEHSDGAAAAVTRARGALHSRWAEMHEARALAQERRAEGDTAGAKEQDRRAAELEESALAAEQRVAAAEHRAVVAEVRGEREDAEETERSRGEAAEAHRRQRERDERIRARIERRRAREAAGLRRLRPGPGPTSLSPSIATPPPSGDEDLDREIEVIARALDEHGATGRRELAGLVGARYWGPGRFRNALREAVAEGRARQLSRSTFGPAERDAGDRGAGEG